MLRQIVLLSIAGACGTLCRYGLSNGVHRFVGRQFPWGTLAVNALGCFLFAVIWGLAAHRQMINQTTKITLVVGFMGAFTTMSSFAFETFQLHESGKSWAAAINVGAQNLLAIAAIWLGLLLTRPAE